MEMKSQRDSRSIFISGGTGYLGRHLIPKVLEHGQEVLALVRAGSEKKVDSRCKVVVGNALDENTFAQSVAPADTFVHMIGVPHPSPSKATLFRSVDLPAVQASVKAAKETNVRHFVYVSVAHPAPVMKAYVESRQEGEKIIRDSGLNATFLRPWYVLGPGHRWAYLLLPLYWYWERRPASRETASRLGLVKLKEMVAALVEAVEHPANGIRVMDVPAIRLAATGG
jgi:uncharacterized protein YbjT (DUF2867 family)